MNSHEKIPNSPQKDGSFGAITRRDISMALLFAPFALKAAPNLSRA